MTYLKLANGALVPILASIIQGNFGSGAPGSVDFCLYQMPHTPVGSDTAATYLPLEATFPGYHRMQVFTADWTAPFLNGSQANSTGPNLSFVKNLVAGPINTIYGYFVLDYATGLLRWAQQLQSPRLVQNPGDSVELSPGFTFLSEF